MAAQFLAAAVGHNSDGAVRNVPQQCCEWLFEMEYHRVIVGRIDAINQTICSRFGAANLSLQQGIESPLYVARGKRAPIMKSHALMQMKNIRTWIRNFPAF